MIAAMVGDGAMAEGRQTVSVQGGVMTDNTWQDILFEQPDVRFRNARALGVSAARDWQLGGLGFGGIEASLTRHFGEQDHWELSVPVYLRSFQPRQRVLPGVLYGLGLSYATDVPEVEIDRRGVSQRLLAYWFIDLEFGAAGSDVAPFLRLHHRSDAFGLFDADTGSNLLMLGLRRAFGS